MKKLKIKDNTSKFIIIGLASAFLFGAATPSSKALLSGLEAQTLAGLLYLGAAIGVLPMVIRERSLNLPWRAGRRSFLLLIGAILLGGILGPLLLLLGLKTASSGSVSLWLNLEVAATALLGHLIFQEKLYSRGWIAAGGTLIAVLLLAGEDGSGGILATILISLGCLCWGFDNHFTALIDHISPAQTSLWKGIVAGIFNLSLGIAIAGEIGRPSIVLAALFVGAISYGLSMNLYVTSAQGLGATRSQMVFSVAPFFGLILSVTVLGEAFTYSQAVAAGLIVISLMILFSEKHVHIHQHDFMSHQHLHGHDGSHHTDSSHGHSKDLRHAHLHEHSPFEHAHKHWPDLHHRHEHDNDDKS